MPESSRDPYEGYTIAQWKWEFLRRNSRYRRAYQALEWLKKKPYQRFGGFRRVARYFELLHWLQQQLGLDPEVIQGLPSPDLLAHEFERCPIKGSHILLDHEDFAQRRSFGSDDPLPVIDYLADHEVLVLLDTRFGLKEIFSDLKVQLAPYLAKRRNRVPNYKDYLTIWDLRQQHLTADKIASRLWPDEYEKLAKKDYLAEEKNPLHQRVHDHEKAAQRLIDESFPPRKRYRKIKK